MFFYWFLIWIYCCNESNRGKLLWLYLTCIMIMTMMRNVIDDQWSSCCWLAGWLTNIIIILVKRWLSSLLSLCHIHKIIIDVQSFLWKCREKKQQKTGKLKNIVTKIVAAVVVAVEAVHIFTTNNMRSLLNVNLCCPSVT